MAWKKTGRKQFWTMACLAMLAVMAVAVVSFALLRPTPGTPVSEAAARYTPAPQATKKVVPIVAFVGDSYTAGARSSAPDKRWSSVSSSHLGWVEKNFGRGGTGYVATAGKAGCGLDFCPNYAGMIADVAASKPKIVVVSGGRNDVMLDPAAIKDGVTGFFTALRAALPDATILAVSPVWDDNDAPDEMADIAALVQAQSVAVGGKYLDIGQPLLGRPELLDADGVHPNDKGYAVLAEAVDAAVKAAIPAT